MRSQEIQRVEIPMSQVNEGAYAPVSTPVLASTIDTESTIVGDLKHTVGAALEKDGDLEPVEEIWASWPSMWITATPIAEASVKLTAAIVTPPAELRR